MRCFLAIELSEEVKTELLKIQEILKEEIIGKFVEKENLHLTLKFFGELDKDEVNKVKNELKKAKFEKVVCSLGRTGFFPNNKFINVVWVSLEPRDEINRLKEEIEKVLENSGQEKKFECHVTLVRVKKVKDKLSLLKKVQDLKIKPDCFEVKDFVLKKSTLTSEGPVYEDIERFALS